MGRAVNSLPGFATAKGAYSLSSVVTVPIGRQCNPVKGFLIVVIVRKFHGSVKFQQSRFSIRKGNCTG